MVTSSFWVVGGEKSQSSSAAYVPTVRAYRAAYVIPPLDPEIKQWTTPPSTEPEHSQWIAQLQQVHGSESLRAKLTERHTNITEAVGKAYDTVIPDIETALLEANLNPFRRDPAGSVTKRKGTSPCLWDTRVYHLFLHALYGDSSGMIVLFMCLAQG